MEFVFLGLLFFLGFTIIPIFLILGFVLLKIIIWSAIIVGLLIMFGGGLGFLVLAGFVAYLFFYWLFGSKQNA